MGIFILTLFASKYFIYIIFVNMIKTKIKKAMAVTGISAITIATLGASAFAAQQIGTGSVTWTTSFDSPINWDWTYGNTANASGSVANILVTASVDPTLNMEISTGTLNLGTLVAWTESTGSVNIEIGTNAANWASITARSQSGWLTNTSDNSIQINDLTADGVAESYKFYSQTWATADSTVTWFSQTANANTEVDDNTTEHVIYTSNKPQAKDWVNDVVFTVWATANAQTPAGNYEDHITFTVTGNF